MGVVFGFAASSLVASLVVAWVDLTPLWLFVLAAGALTGTAAWIAAAIRHLAGGFVPDEPGPGPLPGERHRRIEPYLRRRVFADLRGHWRHCVRAARFLLGGLHRTDAAVIIALWPVFTVLALFWSTAVVAIAALALAFTAVALAFAASWRLLWAAGGPALRLLHRLHRQRTGPVLVCPNGGCLRSSARPSYRCGGECDDRHDRFPSAAGVLWVRDRHGHRRSTLPFLGAPAEPYCVYCDRPLGLRADREAHRQVLVTGPSGAASAAFVADGLGAVLMGRDADGEALARAASEGLGGERDTFALRVDRGLAAPIRLHCKVADESYLHSVGASADLAVFDECASVVLVLPTEHGRLADPPAARQAVSVLRQRLALHRADTDRLPVAVVAIGAGDPASLPDCEAIRAGLAVDLPAHRWVADGAEAWRWLTAAAPGRVTLVAEPGV